MSKATIKSLVSDLAFSMNDEATTEEHYVDSIRGLAQMDYLTEARLIQSTEGTSTYVIPDDIVRILEIFHDTSKLGREEISSLQSWNSEWRDEEGTPHSYVVEQLGKKTIRVVPTPDKSSSDFSFALGAGFGTDFPENSLLVIHSETPSDVQDWLDLPVALDILGREFTHESDHQDIQFGALCKQFSQLLLG